jgi:hypothetical protein
MSKNLNSEFKKRKRSVPDSSKHGVEGSPGALGGGPYWERHAD